MKWKTDLHLNKTEIRVNSVVEKLGEATTRCLQRLKRKVPSSCNEEEVNRLKKDGGHDDQGPSHPEGEKDATEEIKTAETSNPAYLTQETSKPHKPRNNLLPWSRKIPYRTQKPLKPTQRHHLNI